jgi:hypothetical protein
MEPNPLPPFLLPSVERDTVPADEDFGEPTPNQQIPEVPVFVADDERDIDNRVTDVNQKSNDNDETKLITHGNGDDDESDDESEDEEQSESKRERVEPNADEQGGEEPYDDAKAGICPTYYPNRWALRVFADPFFYHDDISVAQACVVARRTHLQGLTIADVLMKYPRPADLADIIHCSTRLLQQYIDQRTESTEAALHRNKLVLLNAQDEFEEFYKRYIPLSNYSALYVSRPPIDPKYRGTSRWGQIIYVLGPSGIGKSYFALGDAATRDDKNPTRTIQGLNVTFYFNVYASGKSEMRGTSMLQMIREAIKSHVPWYDESRLDMHVSLVVDEAASSSEEGFFEQRRKVMKLYDFLETNLATSFRLVVAGTGLFGTKLSSSSDCLKIRMKQWTRKDFSAIVGQKIGSVRRGPVRRFPTLQARLLQRFLTIQFYPP